MTQVAEHTGVAELIEQVVAEAREYGEIHLDVAMMKLRVELTPDVLTALKAACERAGVRLDEGVDDQPDDDEDDLSPADELARARRRRAAARSFTGVKATAPGGRSGCWRAQRTEM